MDIGKEVKEIEFAPVEAPAGEPLREVGPPPVPEMAPVSPVKEPVHA